LNKNNAAQQCLLINHFEGLKLALASLKISDLEH